jgi:hypothetical protein
VASDLFHKRVNPLQRYSEQAPILVSGTGAEFWGPKAAVRAATGRDLPDADGYGQLDDE